MPAREGCRGGWMAGLAPATMVPSRATIITPSATVSGVRGGLPGLRRPRPPPGSGPGAAVLATTEVAAVFVCMMSSLPGARCRAPSCSEFVGVAGPEKGRPSGSLPAPQEEGGACPDRDGAHAGAGRNLLHAVQGEPGGHAHDEDEQEQEPQQRLRRAQRLYAGFGRGAAPVSLRDLALW